MQRSSSRPGAATNTDQHLPYNSRLDPWVWDQVEELLPKKPKNMRLGPKMDEHRAYCLNRVLNRVLPRADGAGTASIHEEDIPLLLDVSAPYGERVAGLRELGWEELPTKEEIKLNVIKRLEIEYVDHALLGEPSDDEDYGDDSDGESDGGLDFLERLGGGGDPYLDDDGDGVFDPGDCDY